MLLLRMGDGVSSKSEVQLANLTHLHQPINEPRIRMQRMRSHGKQQSLGRHLFAPALLDAF